MEKVETPECLQRVVNGDEVKRSTKSLPSSPDILVIIAA